MARDLKALAAELMSAGQLSDFLEEVGATTPFYNCSTIAAFPEGPNGPGNRGNLYFRHNVLCEKGARMQGECHPYPHSSLIFGGKFLVKTWRVNPEGKRTGPIREAVYGEDKPGTFAVVYIEANVWHEFTALNDGATLVCVYAMRDSKTGELVEQFDGDRQPYLQKKGPWPVL